MDACPIPQAAEPCALVIFGASGDLTKRKLLPSLYNLASYHLLPADFSIIGVARRPLSDDIFRDQLGKALAELGTQPVDPNLWSRFRGRISYCAGEFDNPETYKKLKEALDASEKEFKTSGNVVFYLSVQPDFFATIAQRLSEAGLLAERDGRWRRVIIEKPFGHDLASARTLNAQLTSVLKEHQIYRIDHYLGKETAQNLLVFRLGNAIFEPIWNRRYIDHVQLTVAESIGVEGRGAFYESCRRLPRRDAESHVYASCPDRNGAADLSGGRSDPERKGQIAPFDPTDNARGSPHEQLFAGSTEKGSWTARRCRLIVRNRMWIRIRPWKRLPRSSSGSRTGDGRECRFICVRGNDCRNVPRVLSFGLRRRRCRSLRPMKRIQLRRTT